MTRTYTLTYTEVTPESAELGDFSDHGFGLSSSDGTSLRHGVPDPGPAWEAYMREARAAATDAIEPDPDEVADDFAGDESACAVAMMVRLLTWHYSAREPSPWSAGCWYTEPDGSTDFATGAVTRVSVHLDGWTDEEQCAIYAAVTGRK